VSHKVLSYFANLIEQETGIVFHESNLYQLQSRLEEIAKLEGLIDLEKLLSVFERGTDYGLKQRLLDHSTNNETLFFRDPAFFDAIRNFIVNEILPQQPNEIRIWSAASSTGQEAVSVAILLEELAAVKSIPPYKILGTDICQRALDKARDGIYSEFELMRGLSEERRRKFFVKTALGCQVNQNIKSKISFQYNNLLSQSVSGSFHLILCRNVLIYQKVSTKKLVVDSLISRMENSGGLILGVGETLMGVTDQIQTTMQDKVIIYRKKNIKSKLAA
jgi:chemotaxis protein methyltransferase CheR